MPDRQSQSLRSLFGEALGDAADLARNELMLLRAEVAANLRLLFVGLTMVVAAAVFAIGALMLFTEALVDRLAALPDSEGLATLMVGTGMVLIALALVLYARRILSIAGLAPIRTARSLKRDAEILSKRVAG